MAQKLEKGKVVTIYADPITEQKPEGKARLINQIFSKHYFENTFLEYWYVRFPGDTMTYPRTILALQN